MIKQFIFTIFILSGIVYFSYHAICGSQGVIAKYKLSQELNILQNELDIMYSERSSLESKTNRLSNESVDLDLLDEQARKVLGYSREREMIIFLP